MRTSGMKFRFVMAGFAMVCVLLISVAGAQAAWKMEIESKTVNTGQTGVTLNFTFAWDLGIQAASLPLVVRSITPGAFWTGSLPYDTMDFNGDWFTNGVAWHTSVIPWAGIYRGVRVAAPILGSYCGSQAPPPYDGVSPDHASIATNGISSLAAKPNGIVFVTLTFNVTQVPGQFEFDTACFSSSETQIFMVDALGNDHGNETQFIKGIVTLNSAVNDPPILASISPQRVNTDDSLKFVVSAVDPDGTTPVLTAENLPPHATFFDSANGRGLFKFYPTINEAGNGAHYPHFIASDGTLADTMVVTLVVVGPDGILSEETNVPTGYSLFQNHPNPFNANTLIEFSLRETGAAKLEIYNILGQKVAVPIDGVLSAGVYSANWNGKDESGRKVPSGMYFYRLTAGEFTQVKKMVLMK